MPSPSAPTLQRLLLGHAESATSLAALVTQLEKDWLEFVVNGAEAKHLPLALEIIGKADRLRRGMAEDTIRVAALIRELLQPRVSVSVRDSAVLVAPDTRRGRQAD